MNTSRTPLIPRLAAGLRARGWRGPARACLRGYARLARDKAPSLRQLCAWALEDGDTAAAETLCREILELAPGDSEALAHLGRLALARNAVDEALAWFRRHDAGVAGDDVTTRALRKQHLDLALARTGRAYYKRLENVLVDAAYWSVVDGNVVYSDDILGKNLYNSPWVGGRISRDGATVVYTMPPPRATIDEECILVGGDENYSHWLLRYLPKLSTLDAEGLLERYPWLVNRDLRPHQQQYLELLGVAPGRLRPVERDAFVRCRRLVVPALLISKPAIAAGIEWLHRKVAQHLVPPAEARRRIFVSRSDAAYRYVLNEDELYAALEPFGFERLLPGTLSVAEQIRAFSGARAIVGVHGASLANLAFAPRDAAVVEITSSALRMDDFRRLAACRGQCITTIVSDRYPAHAGAIHVNSDYLVDVDTVLATVRKELAAST